MLEFPVPHVLVQRISAARAEPVAPLGGGAAAPSPESVSCPRCNIWGPAVRHVFSAGAVACFGHGFGTSATSTDGSHGADEGAAAGAGARVEAGTGAGTGARAAAPPSPADDAKLGVAPTVTLPAPSETCTHCFGVAMPRTPPPAPTTLLAVDCEMCHTAVGLELTRVTVTNQALETVFDSLVVRQVAPAPHHPLPFPHPPCVCLQVPANPITDYVTQFSGITADMLEDVSTTLQVCVCVCFM